MPTGPLCACKACGHEIHIRLKRGVKLKYVTCEKCGRRGFRRWTRYDKALAEWIQGGRVGSFLG